MVVKVEGGRLCEQVLLDAEEMMESLRSYIFELNAALGREDGGEGGPHQASFGLAIPKEDTARALALAHAVRCCRAPPTSLTNATLKGALDSVWVPLLGWCM